MEVHGACHEGMWWSGTVALLIPNFGSRLSASSPVRFSPRERDPNTHWTGGWVGPRDGLDSVNF